MLNEFFSPELSTTSTLKLIILPIQAASSNTCDQGHFLDKIYEKSVASV
jgi:hypothetical protein